MKLLRVLLYILLFAVGGCEAGTDDMGEGTMPNERIAQFIAEEFSLREDERWKYGMYTTKKGLRPGTDYTPSNEGENGNPSVFAWTGYSHLIVAKGYSIGPVAIIDHSHAEVAVIFDTIAELSEGSNTRKLKRRKASETVAYNLLKVKGKWYVLNPPAPRAGIAGLISYYERQVTLMQSIVVGGKASTPQVTALHQFTDLLAQLRGLPSP